MNRRKVAVSPRAAESYIIPFSRLISIPHTTFLFIKQPTLHLSSLPTPILTSIISNHEALLVRHFPVLRRRRLRTCLRSQSYPGLPITSLRLPSLIQLSIQADISCYCTGPSNLNPDKTAKVCCTDTSGVTYPDGTDRPGAWNEGAGTCRLKTDGLGFTLNEMIQAWSPCCLSTGPQGPNNEDLLWGGNCS